MNLAIKMMIDDNIKGRLHFDKFRFDFQLGAEDVRIAVSRQRINASGRARGGMEEKILDPSSKGRDDSDIKTQKHHDLPTLATLGAAHHTYNSNIYLNLPCLQDLRLPNTGWSPPTLLLR